MLLEEDTHDGTQGSGRPNGPGHRCIERGSGSTSRGSWPGGGRDWCSLPGAWTISSGSVRSFPTLTACASRSSPWTSRPQTPRGELRGRVQRLGLSVDLLVNNAGFGLYGKFLDVPWERVKSMIELDILTLAHMTRVFAEDMVKRGFGRILQVSSIGAFQPTPTYAAYSAAKSFVLSFGDALCYELRGTGVSCTVICPGVTATEFLAVAGQGATAFQRMTMMKSPDVARVGIEALLRGKSSVVPGAVNAVLAWSTRLFTRQAAAAMSSRLMTSG